MINMIPRSLLILWLTSIRLLSLAQTTVEGQNSIERKTSRSDSGRIDFLLQRGKFLLEKPGEFVADLDSAMFLAHEAGALSRKAGDHQRLDRSVLLEGRIQVEARRYDRAEYLLPLLSDTGRAQLLFTMLDYRLNTLGNDTRDADTALPICRRLIQQGREMKSLAWEAMGWMFLADFSYWLRDESLGEDAVRHGWSVVRQSKNIGKELQFLRVTANAISRDSTMRAELDRYIETAYQDALQLISPQESDEVKRLYVYSFAMTADEIDRTKNMALSEKAAEKAISLEEILKLHYPLPQGLLSGIEIRRGDLQKALKYALDAARVSESAPDPMRDGTGYASAGRIYYLLNDIPNSLAWYRKALNAYYIHPNAMPNANLVGTMTKIYLRQGKAQQALEFLDTAERRLRIVADQDVDILIASKADCYFALHRYDIAEKYYLNILEHAKTRTPARTMSAYLSIVKVYLATGRYRKALPYILTMVADSNRAVENGDLRAEALLQLYRADSATGDFRGAVKALQRYQAFKEANFNENASKALQEMTARYEAEKRDRNIARLSAEAAIRDSQLAHDRILRNTLIGASILLLVLLIVLYSRSRLRQRNHRLLQQLNAHQQQVLLEKQWLVRETHHRVKNNLELVIGLLNMQAGTLEDQLAQNAFADIGGRIRAISLVHQKLYREQEDGKQIDMQQYIGELVHFVEDGLENERPITFRQDVGHIELDANDCLAVGLILNEALSNSLKHAFPNDQQDDIFQKLPIDSQITITLKEIHAEMILLRVTDNGVGFPTEFNTTDADSLGLQLIRRIASQLGATLKIESGSGVIIEIIFARDSFSAK